MAGIGQHEGPSNFVGFLRSALSAGTRELVGLPPNQDIELWRSQHPMGSIISSLGGFAVPFAGWAGAASKIPKLGQALSRVGSAERMAEAPFKTGMQVEALRFTPFEAARIGGAMLTGGDVGHVAMEAGVDLLGAGVIGGALARVRAGRAGVDTEGQTPVGRVSDLVPGFSHDLPLQQQIQLLREAKLAQPQHAALFDTVMKNRTLNVYAEAVPEGGKYVNGIHLDQEAERSANRLFKLRLIGEESSTASRSLLRAGNGFETTIARDKFLLDAGIGDQAEFAANAMYPRAIQTNPRAASSRIAKVFEGDAWQKLTDGWFVAREAWGNQAMVLAKKVGGHSKPGKEDNYLLFKTNNPAKFLPEYEAYKDRRLGFWNKVYEPRSPLIEDAIGAEIPIYQNLKAYNSVAGPDAVAAAFAMLPKDKANTAVLRMARSLSETVFGKRRGSPPGDEVGRVGMLAREYVLPAEFQMAWNVRARAAFGLAKAAADGAVALAHKAFYGDTKTLTNGYRYALAREPSGGLQKVIDSNLNEKNIGDFHRAVMSGKNVEVLEANGLDKGALTVIKTLNEMDIKNIKELEAVYKLVGDEGGFRTLENHYMMTRTWKGDQRVGITDETGQRMLAVAAGETRQKAMQLAQAFVKEASTQGLGAKVGRVWTRGSKAEDLETAARIVKDSKTTKAGEIMEAVLGTAYEPGFTKVRTGVRGFIGDFEKLTVKDVKQIAKEHLEGVEKLKAEMTARHMLGRTLEKVHAEDPIASRILNKRIDDTFGKAGPWTQAINSTADRVLAPIIGGQSATKIARAVNTGMFNLSFGFGNLGFAALNAVTPVITAMPEVAFVMGARPQTLMRYYGIAPMIGADGTVRGATGFLEPLRVMREAFRTMGKPDDIMKGMYDRAAQEGVTVPRMVEEYVGSTSSRATHLRDVLNGKQGVGGFIQALSEWLPGTSEKFARLQSFTMGANVASKFLNLEGEAAYQFAKRFTERTMYNYGSMDRARVMTGPVGSVFGLYKNWMMNYVGNWMIYANEAIATNQWKPLMWATAAAYTTGGVAGMGPASALLDGAVRTLGDDSAMQVAYKAFGEDAGDAMFYGLPGLFGLSLVTSGAAPGSEVMRDVGFMANLAIWDRAKALGRTVGGAIDSFTATGQHPVYNESVRDNFARAFAPRTIYKALSVMENDEIKSLQTGNPLIKNIDGFRRTLYAIGVNPVEVDKTFALAREIWQSQTEMKNHVKILGKQWEAAEDAKDYTALTRVYNLSLGLGIADRVMRSARSVDARERQTVLESAGRGQEDKARVLGVR